MRWQPHMFLRNAKRATLQHKKIVYFELFLGSRRVKNRSILAYVRILRSRETPKEPKYTVFFYIEISFDGFLRNFRSW